MSIDLSFTDAEWLSPEGFARAPLAIADGKIADQTERCVALPGKLILPGIVDLHICPLIVRLRHVFLCMG